jgi:3-hydroxymyristoyl/3-hydroxydecanoyl-(acyl carrier protein) dehydratase
MKIESNLIIAANHPAFAGHFPGRAIVPGVVLLDAVLRAIVTASRRADGEMAVTAWQISAAKFLSPLTPGEAVVIVHEHHDAVVKFEVLAADRKIVSGSLLLVNRS